MKPDDYWTRRASQEEARAEQAGSDSHRDAHLELAEIFRHRVRRVASKVGGPSTETAA